MNSHLWTQLEGVEQILSSEGWNYEQLRRKLLDRFYSNGYELVIPPLVDFVENLLSGTNQDLDLLTVKVPDHVSGRMYGIRADMTPQVARIAALQAPQINEVIRLCYLGPTLLARTPDLGGSRELLQFGAELFGSSAPESDCEVIRLMVEVLQTAGVNPLSVSIGHVGIFREVFKLIDLDGHVEGEFLEALQRKSKPDIDEVSARYKLDEDRCRVLKDLTDLNGSVQISEQANLRLGKLSKGLDSVLEEVAAICDLLCNQIEGISLHLDYAQVGSYKYHTGVIFSAYGPGYGQALAKGGRYDDVLSAYGTPCPATGFSGDLRLLRHRASVQLRKAILVPAQAKVPSEVIERLFRQKERVIYELPNQGKAQLGTIVDRKLVEKDGSWVVVHFNSQE